jgi:hypothetical protein
VGTRGQFPVEMAIRAAQFTNQVSSPSRTPAARSFTITIANLLIILDNIFDFDVRGK